MADKSTKLTTEQDDMCYEIKFAFMRAILNMSNEKLWDLIYKAMGEQNGENND